MKINSIYVGLLLLPEICNYDNTLNQFKTSNIVKNAPKIWHAYIRKFTHRYAEGNVSYYVYSKSLSDIVKYSKLFGILAKGLMKYKCTNWLFVQVLDIKWVTRIFI